MVTLEEHLRRAPDGHIYTDGPGAYSVWSELLDNFDEVVLLARVAFSSSLSSEQNRIEGPFISVHELPNYSGPWQYLRSLSKLRVGVRRAIARCDVCLLRVPGLVSRLAWHEIRRSKNIYAAEVVGDPSDALGKGTMPSLLRPLYRLVAIQNMKKICRQASAVLYCCKRTLPNRYPPGTDGYTAFSHRAVLTEGYASQELMKERRFRIEEKTRSNNHSVEPLRFGFVGSFAQLYKGADTLLRAASICSQNGLQFRVFFAGEGRYRSEMQSLAADLSIQERVFFLGQLNFGKPIFDFLDSLDLYLMPSRAEAFGRALLEAMARGCPCIGSNVGGIAEQLALEDLFPPNNHEALAQKIMEVTANPERMKAMSERNLARAKQLDPEVLRDTRLAFYRYVRDHSGNNAKSGSEQQSSLQLL